MTKEILVLGGENVGKSLMIRRILEIVCNPDRWDCEQSNEETLPTVGVELHTVSFGQDKQYSLREIGSSLSSKWESYFCECDHIIFLIDVADFGSVASSIVLFHELLAHEETLNGKKIALGLNKLDIVDSYVFATVYNLMQVDDLIEKGIDILQGSCMDGSLCRKAIEWLKEKINDS